MGMLTKKQRESLERATLDAMENVHLAEEYLAGRGIDLEVARSNGLGVVVEPAVGQEHMRGMLSIPYMTDSGPVNMNARCFQDHDCKELKHSKYMNWHGGGVNLYGVQSLNAAGDWIAIAEGEFDAMILNMCGIPAVGVPGAEKFEPFWKNIFEDFSRVYLFHDADKAGEDMGKLYAAEVGAIRVRLPQGYDVNKFYLEFGQDALRGKIRK